MLIFLLLPSISIAKPLQPIQTGTVEEEKQSSSLQKVDIQIYGKLYSILVIIHNPNPCPINIAIHLRVTRFFGGKDTDCNDILQPDEVRTYSFFVGIVASGYIKIICEGVTMQSYRFYKYGPILQLIPWEW